MLVKELYTSAARRLTAAGIPAPDLEAGILLGHILRLNRTELMLAADRPMSPATREIFEKKLQRRLHREPIAYILGQCEFWSLPFQVTSDVLVPRPETEVLIEKVLAAAGIPANIPAGPILDLGTGSGAIAIVLALEMRQRQEIYGLDLSQAALRVAMNNAVRHQVADRVRFIRSDWLTAVAPQKQFPLIVANPPYVERELLEHTAAKVSDTILQPEVLFFEPHLALNGGKGGMEKIEQLARGLPAVLMPGGWFFMEVGAGQADQVMKLFDAISCFEALKIHDDYGGLPRVFQARRRRDGR
jgi:release factor glutamine methyltransferase